VAPHFGRFGSRNTKYLLTDSARHHRGGNHGPRTTRPHQLQLSDPEIFDRLIAVVIAGGIIALLGKFGMLVVYT
jgi:hypothetical protein